MRLTLETDRLILRKNVIEDAKMMFENWASDSEVLRDRTATSSEDSCRPRCLQSFHPWNTERLLISLNTSASISISWHTRRTRSDLLMSFNTVKTQTRFGEQLHSLLKSIYKSVQELMRIFAERKEKSYDGSNELNNNNRRG